MSAPPRVMTARVVPIATLAFAAALFLFWSNRGFDITDEAYYLAWIAAPDAYEVAIHPSGLFFHALVWPFAPHIVALRLVGILLVAGSGGLLGMRLAQSLRAVGVVTTGVAFPFFSAVAALGIYFHGIVTPGYNHLVIVGANLAAAGLIGWARPDRDRASAIDSILVGVGACLAFLGKPTFALLLALAVAGWLAAIVRQHPREAARRALVVALACFAPLLAIIATSVGIGGFIGSVVAGREVLDFNNSIPRLLARTPREILDMPLYLTAPATALALVIAMTRDGPPGRNVRRLLGMLFAIVALVVPYVVARWIAMGAEPWAAAGPALLALALAAVAYLMARGPAAPPVVTWTIVVFLLAPMLIGFGTANNWLLQTAFAIQFMLLAIMVGVVAQAPRAAATVQGLLCGGVAIMLGLAALWPYRLPAPLWAQTEALKLPLTGDTLGVDPPTWRLGRDLGAIGRAGGISLDTPLIDLGNNGPGIARLLSARAPYFPWLNANFGNAQRLADAAWGSLSPSDRARAWLVGPIVPALAGSAAARHYHTRRTDYIVAGRTRHPLTGKPIVLVRPR